MYCGWAFLGLAFFLGLNVAVSSLGQVPDYDGVSYLEQALRVHIALWTGGPAHAWSVLANSFTNTLDILLVALLWNVLDYHLAVWFVHTAYIVIFAALLRRIFSPAVSLLIIVFAMWHGYFFRQYTGFISEMKVGMFLALFCAYLFHPEVRRHLRALFWITIILLLLRVVNLLFLGALATAFIIVRWREGMPRREIAPPLKAIALAVLILSPVLLHELPNVVYYVVSTTRNSAANWRDMSGIYDKRQLIKAYWDGVQEYNKPLVIGAVMAILGAAAAAFGRRRERLKPAGDMAIAFAAVAGTLMLPATTNIMVVYWVFLLLGLLAAQALSVLVQEKILAVAACVLVLPAALQIFDQFVDVNRGIENRRPIAEVTSELAKTLGDMDHPVLFQNFGGVGPLDTYGMEVRLGRVIGWPTVNAVRYSTPIEDYLAAMRGANVAFIANRNFMWPNFVGVNRKTSEIARYMAENGEREGMLKVRRVLFDSDSERYIDVYVRPTVRVNLKYRRFGDTWMDRETSLEIRTGGGDLPLIGYDLTLAVVVPGVNDPDFRFPIVASLLDAQGRTVGRVRITRIGSQSLTFPLDGLTAGRYQLVFDKTFQPANDARRLAVGFQESFVKYRGAH